MPLVSMQSDEVGRKKKKYVDPRCIVHNKIKRYCLPCGGKIKYKTCNSHNKRYCIPCDMKRPARKRCDIHNKVQCVLCGSAPNRKCPHERQRSQCVPCHGTGICYHERVRRSCIPCHGSKICQHQRFRIYCSNCRGSNVCASCCLTIVHHKDALCSRCDPKAITRSPVKEASVAAYLAKWASEGLIKAYDSWNKTAADSSTTACGRFRPDFGWNCITHTVMLEVDEHQHTAYNTKCEFQRMCSLIGAFGGPVRIVRFNTDAFKIAGKTCNIRRSLRRPLLLQHLQHALTTPPSALITVEYLYYSQQTQPQEHIQRFSFQEQISMAKWIDELESSWDDLSISDEVKLAADVTSSV